MENGNNSSLKYVGIIGIIGIGLYFLTKSQGAKQLNAEPIGIKNIKINVFEVSFDLILSISNTSNQSFRITGIGGYTYLNSQVMATSNQSEDFTIKSFGDSTVTVPTVIRYSQLSKAPDDFVRFIKYGTPLKLKWKGIARTLGLNIPLETSFTLNNPFKKLVVV